MNRFVSYTTLLALAITTPVLFADLSAQMPAAAPAATRGNCDLLASNTVRATFVGLHDLAVQTINDATPSTAQVAVFEVIDLLGYKKYNRLGDGQLTPGTKFTVAMNRELPGQPADIADTIGQMQPGEEAVLKIDHLYLMNGPQGEPLRVCSRMARRAAQPAVTTTEPAPAPAGEQPAPAPLPDTLAPLGGAAAATGTGNVQFSASSTSVSVTRDENGNIVQTRTESKFDPASGQMKTRMFINGTEVDPQTRQPLAQPVSAPAPAAEAAPAPAADKPAEEPKPAENDDDTVVEHVDAPAPQPAPEAATPTAPAPAPAAEEEGF